MTQRTSGLWSIFTSSPGGTRRRVFPFAPLARPLGYVVQVADTGGRFIGELQPWGRLRQVIWRVSEHGTATLELSPRVRDRDAAADLLRYGNMILVRFDGDVLPPWGGTIEPPRSGRAGSVEFNAYGGEYMAERWQTPATASFEAAAAMPAAAVWRTLVSYGAKGPFDVAPADESDGAPVEVSFTLQPLSAAAETLARLDADFRWHFEPYAYETSGAFRFRLRTFQRVRRDLAGTAVLSRGLNFTDVEVMGQGPIHNVVTVVPANADYNDPTTFYTALDLESIALYGERHAPPQVLSEVNDESAGLATTGQYAHALLASYARPRVRISGRQLNVPPTPFGVFWLGDRITVELHGLEGIDDATAVVQAMEYSPDDGTLALVLDVE